MHSFLGVPVVVKGHSVGNLYLTEKIGAPEFSEQDQRLVEMFALHAGIAFENAQLHEQVQRLAIVDERERIGKDLHDGIIQSLYAVGLSLEDVPDLMASEPAEASVRVDRAIDALNVSIRDIRNFIFGLRPELVEQGGLVAGLATLVNEFRLNTLVDADLEAHQLPGGEPAAAEPAPSCSRSRARRSATWPAMLGRAPSRCGSSKARTCSSCPSATTAGVRPDAPRARRPPRAREHGRTRSRPRRPTRSAQRARFRHRYHRPAATRRADPRYRAPRGGAPRRWASGRGGVSREDDVSDAPVKVYRLLVVDDHEVVRQGLVALLDRRDGFQVVAEAGTVAEAIEMARRFQPEIVIMDVRLPDGSGIEACREIRAELPDTRVVILTSYPDEEAVLSAIVAGASGYLLKQVRARDLVAALEAVGRGESLLDPAVTEKVLERVRRIATGAYTDELAQLTQQEQKILLLVAEGKTNKEIAAEVFLSDKTVKNYVSSILSKLNLERRAQAAAFVAKHRIPGSG